MRSFATSLLGGICLLAVAGTASADALRLDDAQMDTVTAGNTLFPNDSLFRALNNVAVGKAAGGIAEALAEEFAEENPDAEPPETLMDIIGFLEDVQADRTPPPPADDNGTPDDSDNGSSGSSDQTGFDISGPLFDVGDFGFGSFN